MDERVGRADREQPALVLAPRPEAELAVDRERRRLRERDLRDAGRAERRRELDLDRLRRCERCRLRDAELSVVVVAPAVEGSVLPDRAGVGHPCGDGERVDEQRASQRNLAACVACVACVAAVALVRVGRDGAVHQWRVGDDDIEAALRTRSHCAADSEVTEDRGAAGGREEREGDDESAGLPAGPELHCRSILQRIGHFRCPDTLGHEPFLAIS